MNEYNLFLILIARRHLPVRKNYFEETDDALCVT